MFGSLGEVLFVVGKKDIANLQGEDEYGGDLRVSEQIMESPSEGDVIKVEVTGKVEQENDSAPIVANPRPSLALGRPKGLGETGLPRPRKQLFELPGTNLSQPKTPDNNVIERKLKEIMKQSGILHINGIRYESDLSDLKELGELGFGTSGHVFKMLHVPSQEVIAVKQMRRSGNPEENKRIAMDLEVVLKSHDCAYIVQCLGCFITQAEVWICMELMSTCFDKLLKRLSSPIPEPIIGKVTLATVKALHYLKEKHGVIHRDVKPSNILLDNRGNVKLCDFGISGHLINSKANTKNAGCTAYLAPERINPPDPSKPTYDIRADVWSLGITLVELATSVFPYPGCNSDFEVLSRVLQEDPPSLPPDKDFSPEFRDFIKDCLLKDYRVRPKYTALLEHAFLKRYKEENVDVSTWYAHCVPVSPSPAFRPDGDNAANPPSGHQRSLSDVSHVDSPYRFNSPMLGRRAMMNNSISRDITDGRPGSGPTSPLLLQRFYHQQQQAHRHRSTSVSPCRQFSHHNGLSKYVAGNSGVIGSEPETVVSSGGPRRKLSILLRGLGTCGGSSPDRGRCDGPPEPPPRNNRGASPLLVRRGPASPPDLTSSPILNRRHVSPSPPQPPPRRLSESVSVPGSPHHTRLPVLTPQTFRRFWQSPNRSTQGSAPQN